jgi:hypothetical protein
MVLSVFGCATLGIIVLPWNVKVDCILVSTLAI